MNRLLTKRDFLGGALFLVLVGEVTVGGVSGLFTPPGLLVFAFIYILYFCLIDALAVRYRLSSTGLILVNFALYSVLFTGLFHGEIDDYVTNPENSLITTLIRIQCSFYPIFAYQLLNKLAPRRRPPLRIGGTALVLLLGMLVMTPTKTIGFSTLLTTFEKAPLLATGFSLLAIFAFIVALRSPATAGPYRHRVLTLVSVGLLLIGLLPGLGPFLILLGLMIIATAVLVLKRRFRAAAVSPD